MSQESKAMNNLRRYVSAGILLATVTYAAFARAQPAPPSLAGNAILVTADSFVRAESDLYFSAVVKKDGFGKFEFNREPTPVDEQTVIRG
jgi:hypothetical protein